MTLDLTPGPGLLAGCPTLTLSGRLDCRKRHHKKMIMGDFFFNFVTGIHNTVTQSSTHPAYLLGHKGILSFHSAGATGNRQFTTLAFVNHIISLCKARTFPCINEWLQNILVMPQVGVHPWQKEMSLLSA